MATRLLTIPRKPNKSKPIAGRSIDDSQDEGKIEHNYNEPGSLRGVKPYSVDAGNAQRLWALSEELTGVSFPVNL